MLLYGASGHAKVIIDCLLSTKESIIAIFDDDKEKNNLLGIEILHFYSETQYLKQKIIVSIGDNKARRKIVNGIGHAFGHAMHQTAQISEHSYFGDGSVAFHNSVIQSGAYIGNHVIINTSASVDHDCKLGDYVHIAPKATLCGDVKVGDGTLIGAGATVLPGVMIGKWAIIGAGSVITKNIPDYAVVVGNPGRVLKRNNGIME